MALIIVVNPYRVRRPAKPRSNALEPQRRVEVEKPPAWPWGPPDGVDYFTARRPGSIKANAIRQLQALGYAVTLEPATA